MENYGNFVSTFTSSFRKLSFSRRAVLKNRVDLSFCVFPLFYSIWGRKMPRYWKINSTKTLIKCHCHTPFCVPQVLPDTPILAFFDFLAFLFSDFLAFSCVFPSFSKDFRGFREEKNPCLFGEKPLAFSKKNKVWRVRASRNQDSRPVRPDASKKSTGKITNRPYLAHMLEEGKRPPPPRQASAGEIQKGTGGRGRDRKCHKLS